MRTGVTGDIDLRNDCDQKGVIQVRNLEKILSSLAAEFLF